jgi:hypothetical protein
MMIFSQNLRRGLTSYLIHPDFLPQLLTHFSFSLNLHTSLAPSFSATEWIGEGGTNYRGPAIRKGTQGLNMLHMFLPFLVVSLFAACNPFRRSPSHSATMSQSFRFSVKIFGQSAPAGIGVGGGKFFAQSPNLVSAFVRSLALCLNVQVQWALDLRTQFVPEGWL